MVAGMGGSHGRRKQKRDHDGGRPHNVRKSQLHSHASSYHGSAILTRWFPGFNESKLSEKMDGFCIYPRLAKRQ
jgi:hypothetical protein